MEEQRLFYEVLRKQRREQLRKESGLSTLNDTQRFDSFVPDLNGSDNSHALRACREYAENFAVGCGRGLLLHGAKGTGKSHLCAAVCNALLDRGIPVKKLLVPDLLIRFRTSFAQEEYNELMRSVHQAKLVWLDELIVSASSSWEETKAFEVLYSVVNAVVEDCNGMLVTTNLSLGDLAEELRRLDPAERLIDRLRGCLTPVTLHGDSVRAKLRQKTDEKGI